MDGQTAKVERCIMTLKPLQYVMGLFSGGLVGAILGLVGGGGSILAVPLMAYLVGVPNPPVSIGTSALAVAANAAAGLANHASAHNVKWRCGGMFAAAGILGALLDSTFGKMVDGEKLLCFFALVMVIVGVLMLRGRGNPANPGAECNRDKAYKVLSYRMGSGLFAGFFGLTMAASYAFSGYVDWSPAGLFIAGGMVGTFLGTKMARKLALRYLHDL